MTIREAIIKSLLDINSLTNYKEVYKHILNKNITILKIQNIYSKTIFHKGSNNNDKQQKWIHPDMVEFNF